MVSIIIDPDGNARHIYSDELVELDRELGVCHVERASHVEPVATCECGCKLTEGCSHHSYSYHRSLPSGWIVDMTPIGGPVAGPFELRCEALSYEKATIEYMNVPEVKP